MSEQLQNLQEMLSDLSPSDLAKLLQATQARSKEVAEELSESKKEFLAQFKAKVEGSVPPEICTISVTFDEEGHVIAQAYKSGEMSKRSKTAGTGDGGNRGKIVNELPEPGSVAYRTYKGEQHTLLYRGPGDFVLDGKTECKSPTEATQTVKGDKTPVNGRAWWFIQGTVKTPE